MFRKLKEMWSGPTTTKTDHFLNVVVDGKVQARLLEKPAASRTFVIHFTARSGSTWLADTLEATGQLGRAREYYNPKLLPARAQKLQSKDLATYADMLPRHFNIADVFSFEITSHQIYAVFGPYRNFHKIYGGYPCFWLIRQDIVSQAISLAKMVTTNVAHARDSEDRKIIESEHAFVYDNDFIKKWLVHIRNGEKKSEEMFAEYSLSPMRLSYEQITAMSAHRVVNLVAKHADLPNVPLMEYPSPLQKIGSTQNVLYADRFREENKDFLRKIDEERAEMLSKLNSNPALAPDPLA
jgi:trehalose 2-sulfotransferase